MLLLSYWLKFNIVDSKILNINSFQSNCILVISQNDAWNIWKDDLKLN